MWFADIDADRRKLLVIRKMIADLERSIEDMHLVAKEMEDHLFDEYEAARLANIRRAHHVG